MKIYLLKTIWDSPKSVVSQERPIVEFANSVILRERLISQICHTARTSDSRITNSVILGICQFLIYCRFTILLEASTRVKSVGNGNLLLVVFKNLRIPKTNKLAGVRSEWRRRTSKQVSNSLAR